MSQFHKGQERSSGTGEESVKTVRIAEGQLHMPLKRGVNESWSSYLALLLVFLIPVALPVKGAQADHKGKLIQYGWDSPDTAFYRKHLKRMEEAPFDGVVFTVRPAPGEGKLGGSDSLGWQVFGPVKFKPEQYQHAIDDLRSAKSAKFTDNFIALVSQPEGPASDWFNDKAWETIAHNAGCLAKVAKAGGCAGIMFDPEEYGFPLWSYARMPAEARGKWNFEDYEAKARQRGGEFIKAINGEFTNVVILSLFGPSFYSQNVSWSQGMKAEANYNLLGPFFDGMIEAATKGTTIVDGYEQSYGFKTENQFVDARKEILEKPRALSAAPKLFEKRMKCGFGLWLDNNSLKLGGWFPKEPSKNYFTPQEWKTTVQFAREHSDGYVWIYNERARWWDGSPGEGYEKATRMGDGR